MIRQSQNYFAAAVSAAILNAAAVAAFVLFTVMSSVSGGFPLGDLFSPANTVTQGSPSAFSGDGGTAPLDRLRPGGAVVSPSALGRSGSGEAGLKQADLPGRPNGSLGGAANGGSTGSAPGGAGTGGGAASGAGGGIGGTGIGGSVTGGGGAGQLPGAPQASGAAQQAGETVSKLPPSVNQSVGGVVDAVDNAAGGSLSQSGVKPVVKGAGNSLLGQGSALGQAANGAGGALTGAQKQLTSGPKLDAAGAVKAVGSALPKTPLG